MKNHGTGYRLAEGGLIDRTRTLQFSFNGKSFKGHPGDTLASALIANGVSLIARSFKYHRPRGFYGAGSEDPNAMLAVRDAHGYDPAIRAGQVRLVEGLEAHSVTGLPSPGFDVGALVQLASGILAAGFYYKTFMWPSWGVFEPFIRRATGFGRPQSGSDHRDVEHRHTRCDVLVIGGGPAGLIAARTLKGTGLDVIIADDQPTLGGSLLWEAAEIDGQSASSFSRKVVSELEHESTFTLLPSTLVTAAYENSVFTLIQALHDERGLRSERHWKVHARHVVLATGLIDRPLLFENNDRPGIMLGSTVRRLISEFGVAPAKRLAVYTNNDSAYLTAIKAHEAGVNVVAIVDTRPAQRAIHADQVTNFGIACYFDSQIVTTSGYRRLSCITIRSRDDALRKIACDGLASSGGWTPLIHLAAHLGTGLTYDLKRSLFVCRQLPIGWFAAGGVNGVLDLEAVFDEAIQVGGKIAAAQIDHRLGDDPKRSAGSSHRVETRPVVPKIKALSFGTVAPQWIPEYGSPKKTWIDLQNDVKVSDIELAVQENYVSVEHLKRYTTLGMGTDQGRTSNVNGLAVLAELTSRQVSDVGTTRFRPPYTAVRMATIANQRRGDLYRPRRLLPADAAHRKLGAVMEDLGWERPDWYRSNGVRREAAIAREMRTVREHVGVFDSSSLGKIEVTGPDAAKFLAKFYVSDISTLKPGRIRYSVMLREDGVIFDDGVVTCIGENHYLASPTSSNAESVAAWFERWHQTEWPAMKVAISPITSNWGSIAVAGPRSRDLLRRLALNFDISNEAFPHMHFRQGGVESVVARVARVSFTGELQYEISVPSRYAASLFETLLVAEGDLTPRPIGLEAWLRLRLEKGYLHPGSDTNGRTTPLDVGMASLVARRKGDFIGKRSLSLSFATSPEREQLVGVAALGGGTLQVGARILAPGHDRVPCPTEGYVTSACFSPSAGRSIGLALVERGYSRTGETVLAYSRDSIVRCQVCTPSFYDSKNERLQA